MQCNRKFAKFGQKSHNIFIYLFEDHYSAD